MILLDTAQLLPAVRALADEKGAHLLHQVSQCYTNAAMYSLLTGDQLSDLEAHGTGYYGGRKYHQPFVDEDGVSRDGVVWPWRDRNMLRVLRTAGFDIRVHNGSRETWWDLFIDHDPLIVHTATMDARGFDSGEALDTVLRADPAWLQQEFDAIARMQREAPERPTFYFVVYHDMHSAALKERNHEVAYASLIDRMRRWDWSEPDSIFWVWSDHGDYGEMNMDGRLRPPNWMSWAMVKDNTLHPIVPQRRVISIRDVRATFLQRFVPTAAVASDTSPVSAPLDHDRIYFVEDSRLASNSEACDATAAVLFIDWRDGLPRLILQCTFDERQRHGWDFQYFVSDFNDGRPANVRAVASFYDDWRVRHLEFDGDPHVRLREALAGRIDWVPHADVEVPSRPSWLDLARMECLRRLRTVMPAVRLRLFHTRRRLEVAAATLVQRRKA